MRLRPIFFRPDMADRRVFLAVTEDDIKNIGRASGVGQEDFLRAVRKGPPWTQSEYDICRKATLANKEWRERKLPYPPYIGFLAAFVLRRRRNRRLQRERLLWASFQTVRSKQLT